MSFPLKKDPVAIRTRIDSSNHVLLASHTHYFFNHLHTVGKEHILWPVGGASVPSACR